MYLRTLALSLSFHTLVCPLAPSLTFEQTTTTMSRPVDSTHPVEPSIARMTEEAAKQKAIATQEKREFAGEDDFKHLDNLRENPNAVLENPLQVRRRPRLLIARSPLFRDEPFAGLTGAGMRYRVSRMSVSRVRYSPPLHVRVAPS